MTDADGFTIPAPMWTDRRCQAITTRGTQCTRLAHWRLLLPNFKGSSLCDLHKDDHRRGLANYSPPED